MPFITEEIWQQLPQRKENESIMIAEFPKPDERYDDEEVADEMGLIIEMITCPSKYPRRDEPSTRRTDHCSLPNQE